MANTSSESPPIAMEIPSSTVSEQIEADVLAAAAYMRDPGCDDSSLFMEDNPNYREFRETLESRHELYLSWSVPQAIQILAEELEWPVRPFNKEFSEGREIGMKILKVSEKMPLLRHESRRFVHRAFDFLNLIKARDKVCGPLGVPGTLQDLCVRSIVQDMKEFKELIDEYHSYSTVIRSRLRTESKMEATRRIESLKQTIRAVKNKLGLASKMQKMASAPNDPSTAPAMTLRPLKRHFKRNLSMSATLMTLQADNRLADFPPVEIHLDLTEFFRTIGTVQNEAEEVYSQKRTPDVSDAHQDDHEMLEPHAEPEPATAVADSTSNFPIPLLRRELAPDRMAFESIAQLNECKHETRQQLESMFWNWSEDGGIFFHKDRFVVLQYLCILSARVRLVEEAATFGELLVLMYREEEERLPSIKNKVILAAALGALSVLLAPTSRKLAAILAAEEGIRILQPFFKDDPARHTALMATLKAVNARTLVDHEARLLSEESKVRMLRKAYRIAGQAAMHTCEVHKVQANSTDFHRCLARAFRIKALAAKAMTKVLLKRQTQHQHPRFPLIASVKIQEPDRYSMHCRTSDYLDGLVETFTVDIANAFVRISELSIQLYRSTDQKVPHLLKPMIGEALLLKAQLLNFYSSQAAHVFCEAVTFYEQLSVKFPSQFDEPITRAHIGLAKRQRWNKNLEGAADSYAIVLQHVLKPFEQAEHY
ncbi:hypothetical protein CF326_g8802, partial [Tilletia indica]